VAVDGDALDAADLIPSSGPMIFSGWDRGVSIDPVRNGSGALWWALVVANGPATAPDTHRLAMVLDMADRVVVACGGLSVRSHASTPWRERGWFRFPVLLPTLWARLRAVRSCHGTATSAGNASVVMSTWRRTAMTPPRRAAP